MNKRLKKNEKKSKEENPFLHYILLMYLKIVKNFKQKLKKPEKLKERKIQAKSFSFLQRTKKKLTSR